MVSLPRGMSFDKSEWIDEMITRAIAGAVTGVVGTSMVPHPAYGLAAIVGSLSGLTFGAIALPIKSLLRRLRERRLRKRRRLIEKESES